MNNIFIRKHLIEKLGGGLNRFLKNIFMIQRVCPK